MRAAAACTLLSQFFSTRFVALIRIRDITDKLFYCKWNVPELHLQKTERESWHRKRLGRFPQADETRKTFLWVLVGLLNPETQSVETANEAMGLRLAIDPTKSVRIFSPRISKKTRDRKARGTNHPLRRERSLDLLWRPWKVSESLLRLPRRKLLS